MKLDSIFEGKVVMFADAKFQRDRKRNELEVEKERKNQHKQTNVEQQAMAEINDLDEARKQAYSKIKVPGFKNLDYLMFWFMEISFTLQRSKEWVNSLPQDQKDKFMMLGHYKDRIITPLRLVHTHARSLLDKWWTQHQRGEISKLPKSIDFASGIDLEVKTDINLLDHAFSLIEQIREQQEK